MLVPFAFRAAFICCTDGALFSMALMLARRLGAGPGCACAAEPLPRTDSDPTSLCREDLVVVDAAPLTTFIGACGACAACADHPGWDSFLLFSARLLSPASSVPLCAPSGIGT